MVELLDRVQAAGFSAAALLSAREPDNDFKAFYERWLEAKPAEVLPYLNNTAAKYDLDKMFPGTQSLLVTLHPYRTAATEQVLRHSRYKIARYAWGRDYHKILRQKLSRVLQEHGLNKEEFRVVVDSTPVNERYYARLAHLGFIGRNGMFINPEQGSFLFIAIALLRQDVSFLSPKSSRRSPSPPLPDIEQDITTYCGSCNLCVKACPTQALTGDGTLRSELCISTLTIENQAQHFAYPQGTKKHNWIFGCDICQQVCPYNKAGFFSSETDFAPRPAAVRVSMGTLPEHGEELFGSSLRRAGVAGLRRNQAALQELNSRKSISVSVP